MLQSGKQRRHHECSFPRIVCMRLQSAATHLRMGVQIARINLQAPRPSATISIIPGHRIGRYVHVFLPRKSHIPTPVMVKVFTRAGSCACTGRCMHTPGVSTCTVPDNLSCPHLELAAPDKEELYIMRTCWTAGAECSQLIPCTCPQTRRCGSSSDTTCTAASCPRNLRGALKHF